MVALQKRYLFMRVYTIKIRISSNNRTPRNILNQLNILTIMIRQAAISLARRGNISYRQSLPKCTQTLIQNSTPNNIGGCRQHRLLTTNTTTSSTTPKVSKDKGQEALEKSQRLHAELKEVSIYI